MIAPAEIPFTFHRRKLARDYVDGLLGVSAFDFGSGLFLTAPRRTGKTTFLREDLIPEIEGREVLSVYVDLWSDRPRDPAELIAEAVKQALRRLEGAASILRGVKKIGLPGGFAIDIDAIGKPSGVTLASALEALSNKAGKPVSLIVDEAQHSLSSQAGVDAMFALKAARDALNIGGTGRRLLLVFTGSHRDKLGTLVANRRQPFYGAQIIDFPLLGEDYIQALAKWMNARLAADNRFAPEDIWTAFQLVGHRPEILMKLLTASAFGSGKAGDLGQTLASNAEAFKRQAWEEFDESFDALTAVQQAVLRTLLALGKEFAPFTAATLDAYGALAGEAVDKSKAQRAIESLREKNLIWRSIDGGYAPEDPAMGDWYASRFAAV